MGMKISTKRHFPATVTVEAQDMRGTFVANIERLSDERLAEIVDGIRDLAERGASTQEMFDYRRQALERHLDSVEGLIDDETGAKIDPKGAARDFVISNAACALETFETLLSAQTGAAAKNSKPSRRN